MPVCADSGVCAPAKSCFLWLLNYGLATECPYIRGWQVHLGHIPQDNQEPAVSDALLHGHVQCLEVVTVVDVLRVEKLGVSVRRGCQLIPTVWTTDADELEGRAEQRILSVALASSFLLWHHVFDIDGIMHLADRLCSAGNMCCFGSQQCCAIIVRQKK